MTLRALTRSLSAFLIGVTIQLDDLDEQARRRVWAAQIDAVVQLVPLTMTINILNAAIVVGVFWNTAANAILSIWGALIVLEAGAALWSWSRRETRDRREPLSARSGARSCMRLFSG